MNNKLDQQLDAWMPQALGVFRIVVGLMFLQHGLQKWFGIPVANPNFANIQLLSMVGIAGVLEIVCGTLVALGLFTRPAAFIASGQMAYAYLIYTNRMARSFAPIANGGNLEVMYCFAFLLLVFAGAGAWSLDAMLRRKS